MSDVVADKKVVIFHYTLTTADGEELDASGDEPMPYLHGADNIVAGLEREMEGKAPGDKFTVVVAPEDGYGVAEEGSIQSVERDAFPAGVSEGDNFVLQTDTGDLFPIWVTEVTDSVVKFDTNHPLAGVELHFEIEIVRIREATANELDHGHPHGLDGEEHHHH